MAAPAPSLDIMSLPSLERFDSQMLLDLCRQGQDLAPAAGAGGAAAAPAAPPPVGQPAADGDDDRDSDWVLRRLMSLGRGGSGQTAPGQQQHLEPAGACLEPPQHGRGLLAAMMASAAAAAATTAAGDALPGGGGGAAFAGPPGPLAWGGGGGGEGGGRPAAANDVARPAASAFGGAPCGNEPAAKRRNRGAWLGELIKSEQEAAAELCSDDGEHADATSQDDGLFAAAAAAAAAGGLCSGTGQLPAGFAALSAGLGFPFGASAGFPQAAVAEQAAAAVPSASRSSAAARGVERAHSGGEGAAAAAAPPGEWREDAGEHGSGAAARPALRSRGSGGGGGGRRGPRSAAELEAEEAEVAKLTITRGMDEAERNRIRREKNRVAARKCRAKKNEQMRELEHELAARARCCHALEMQVETLNRLLRREVRLRELLKRAMAALWECDLPPSASGYSDTDFFAGLEKGELPLPPAPQLLPGR